MEEANRQIEAVDAHPPKLVMYHDRGIITKDNDMFASPFAPTQLIWQSAKGEYGKLKEPLFPSLKNMDTYGKANKLREMQLNTLKEEISRNN